MRRRPLNTAYGAHRETCRCYDKVQNGDARFESTCCATLGGLLWYGSSREKQFRDYLDLALGATSCTSASTGHRHDNLDVHNSNYDWTSAFDDPSRMCRTGVVVCCWTTTQGSSQVATQLSRSTMILCVCDKLSRVAVRLCDGCTVEDGWQKRVSNVGIDTGSCISAIVLEKGRHPSIPSIVSDCARTTIQANWFRVPRRTP